MAWMDLWNSSSTFAKVLAFIGMAMVSVSGLAMVSYTSSLEEKVKKLEDRLDATEYEASVVNLKQRGHWRCLKREIN